MIDRPDSDAADLDVGASSARKTLQLRQIQRTHSALDQIADAPLADIARYPVVRTIAPLSADNDDSGRESSTTDMIARLDRHSAQALPAHAEPARAVHVSRRGSAVSRGLGTLAVVSMAAAAYLSWPGLAPPEPQATKPDASQLPFATDAKPAHAPRTPASLDPVTVPRTVVEAPPEARNVGPQPMKGSVLDPEPAAAPIPPASPPVSVVVTSPPQVVPQVEAEPASPQRTTLAARPPPTAPSGKGRPRVREGYRLFKAGEIEAARALLGQAADDGDSDAAFALGVTFDPKSLAAAGHSVAKSDQEKAVYWYRRAHLLANAHRKRASR